MICFIIRVSFSANTTFVANRAFYTLIASFHTAFDTSLHTTLNTAFYTSLMNTIFLFSLIAFGTLLETLTLF